MYPFIASSSTSQTTNAITILGITPPRIPPPIATISIFISSIIPRSSLKDTAASASSFAVFTSLPLYWFTTAYATEPTSVAAWSTTPTRLSIIQIAVAIVSCYRTGIKGTTILACTSLLTVSISLVLYVSTTAYATKPTSAAFTIMTTHLATVQIGVAAVSCCRTGIKSTTGLA
ncbi:hypothetical protein GN244_ATG10959 [Phytophthora infestans]|uniref:Uncharacterized protein n=1 Tax=Phytophthora infestans TaxID=4787 RepID=A0A833SMZ8_PHYIN|nr:hypothetical protein GN244_ATG10959 [Phytophthora infestans]KAF4129249.1 hypothetical protein GN958_ATG21513 [Phytophthora infestans]